MMIEMNSDEAYIVSALGKMRRFPSMLPRMLAEIMKMRDEYKVIGLMLANIDYDFVREHSPKEHIKAADQFNKWAENNRKNGRKRRKK